MDLRVPQLAEGVTTGTVVSILVSEGEDVSKDQTLLELETEKAVAPIPAAESGKIGKILIKEGDSVSVGQVIMSFADSNGSASTAPSQQAPEATQVSSAANDSSQTTSNVNVPQLAEGINSGTVVSILVSEGDKISKDDSVMELETEKAVAPIPSPVGGTVSKVHVSEGDSVNVGQLILSVVTSGSGRIAEASAPQTPAPPQAVSTDSTVSTLPAQSGDYQYVSSTGAPPPASPTVRHMAKSLGIDLTRVRGSARGGRITVEDLKGYFQRLQQLAAQGGSVASGAASNRPAASSVDFSKWGSVKKEKMSLLRKKIAEKMLESWTTIPHVTQYDSVDITNILALRKKYKDAYAKKDARLTVTSFIYKKTAEILEKYPLFKASIDEVTEEIVYKDYCHIGLAVDTEQGLIVPVIRDVDKKDLVEISKDIADLAARTRDRKIGLEEMQGGTFTISNQGGIGGDHFTPIINKPEVAIFGIGQASKQSIVVDDKPEIRMIMPIALSYDHRLIDGGKAAKFISEFVESLEAFEEKDVKI